MYTDHGCQDSGRPIVFCLCILITDVYGIVLITGCQDSGRPIVLCLCILITVCSLCLYTDHGCQDSGRPIVLCLCILITDVRIVVDP